MTEHDFLKEAHRSVPHLSHEERAAWAKQCAETHPGFIEGASQPKGSQPAFHVKQDSHCMFQPQPCQFQPYIEHWAVWIWRILVLLVLLAICASRLRAQIGTRGGDPVQLPSGGGGGNNLNTVTVSINCTGADKCFKVFADAQVAMTAAYTGLQNSGGTTATALTTHDNDAGGEYLQIGAAGSSNALMTLNNSQAALMFAAGFKTTGTVPSPTCWGTNESGSSSTISVTATPTGGSGHMLVAMARGTFLTGTNTFSFSDGNNTWANLFGLPQGTPASNMELMGGYALNVIGGSYTLTGTFAQVVNGPSIYACEFSNIATSNALDGVGIPFQQFVSTPAASGGLFTTTANDLIVAMGTDNSTTTTWTAGPIGFTSSVTTQASDPPFVAGDVGKKFLASTNCYSGNGFANCTQGIFPGEIASITSAHVAQVNGLPNFGSVAGPGNFTGWFIWGHDDGAQIKAAWNSALTLPGGTLILPCGNMMIGQPPFLSTSAGGVYNPNITGCVGTTLIPTAEYDYSLAVGNGGIFFSYPNTNQSGFGGVSQNPYSWSTLSNFTVWGGGIGGEQNTLPLPIFNLSQVVLNNIAVVGWNWNATTSANAMPAYKVASVIMRNSSAWSAGTGGLFVTGAASNSGFPTSIIDSFFGPQGICATNCGGTAANRSDGLTLQSGYLSTRNSLFFPADGQQHGHGATIAGGFWTSVADEIGMLNVTGAARIFLKGSTTALLSNDGITNAGGFISAQDTQIDTLTQSSGGFIDEGGNYTCAMAAGTPCQGAMTPWITKTITGGTFTGAKLLGADGSGTVTLAAGTGTKNFSITYGLAPFCTCTDQTANASVKCATSTTALTVTGTGTDVIAYACFAQ
jgi:hypothetical protein